MGSSVPLMYLYWRSMDNGAHAQSQSGENELKSGTAIWNLGLTMVLSNRRLPNLSYKRPI